MLVEEGGYKPSRELVLAALGDHKPWSCRRVVEVTGLNRRAAYAALFRCWKQGLVLRTAEPLYEHERVFKGRGGISQNTRPYHLYLLKPENVDQAVFEGHRFVSYDEKFLDPRESCRPSCLWRTGILLAQTGDL